MPHKIEFNLDRNGRSIAACLDAPSDHLANMPWVVMCHGFKSSKNSLTYTHLNQRLLAQGIASVRFDFYGHGQSDGNIEDILISESVADLQAVIDHVQNAFGLPQQYGIFGSSFGGQIAILHAHQNKQLLAMGLKAPLVDVQDKMIFRYGQTFLDEWKHTGKCERIFGDKVAYQAYAFMEDAEQFDIYDMAKQIVTPTFITHGMLDESNPFQHAVKLVEHLGGPALFVPVPGGNHNFTHADDANDIYQSQVTDFFAKHLMHTASQ